MEPVPANKSTGSLPMAIGLTALVLVVPCLAAIGLRTSGLVTSPALLILVPVAVSVLFSHGISEFWKRRRAGSALLFEDLMLWGWLRRRRFEKLLSRTEQFVGPEAGRGLTPDQRAKELERLVGALEARDPRTHGHSKRVARHATTIARSMKLGKAEVARIRTAALLHDVGKIEVPWEILEKPGALTDEEFAEIKKHPGAGARLVEGMGDPELTATVRHHHERIDGGGYPDGIARDEIPVGARIIAVADTFDALTSARSYRQPRSHEEALLVLREEAGAQLDADAVRAFDGRYSSRRPVALMATLLGVGRQAGQSMISFGTGATQVAAVGAAAAVIGAAPAVEVGHQNKPPQQPAIVREAGAATDATATTNDLPGTTTVADESTSGKSRRSSAKIEDNPTRTGGGKSQGQTPGEGTQTSPGDTDGQTGGSSDGSTSGSDGSSGTGGSSGSGSSGSGSSGGSTTTTNPVKTVTDTVQKPVQQVTQTVTDAIPTLPGKDPVSQTVNNTVGGVKDTIGKLTGKP